MPTIVWILLILVALAGGGAAGFVYRRNVAEQKIGRTEAYANQLLEDATRKADEYKKEKVLEAKEEILKAKTENDREMRERRNEVQRAERRVNQREETLDKKADNMEAREESLNKKQAEIQKMREEAEEYHSRQFSELERIAGMTQDEAKQQLVERIQKDAFHDAAAMVRDIETRAKEEGEKKARNIIALAIQKCAADHVAESTVSVIALPNDDMKGRIIGREGRNIRALETATGVDLIIDDTPEAVIVSAFDPVRREIARIAVEKLIMDGRIHPARIEEMVDKARKEVDNQIREAGEQAVYAAPDENAKVLRQTLPSGIVEVNGIGTDGWVQLSWYDNEPVTGFTRLGEDAELGKPMRAEVYHVNPLDDELSFEEAEEKAREYAWQYGKKHGKGWKRSKKAVDGAACEMQLMYVEQTR